MDLIFGKNFLDLSSLDLSQEIMLDLIPYILVMSFAVAVAI